MIDLIARLKARFIAPRLKWHHLGSYHHPNHIWAMYRVRDNGQTGTVFICGHEVATFPSVAKAKRYCEKDHHRMNRLASTAKVKRHDR